jgi:hypothetical protein
MERPQTTDCLWFTVVKCGLDDYEKQGIEAEKALAVGMSEKAKEFLTPGL